MTFPGAGASVYYNDAGEPIGWDYPSEYEPEWYDADYPDYDMYDDDAEDDEAEDQDLLDYEAEFDTDVIFMPPEAFDDAAMPVWDPEEGTWP